MTLFAQTENPSEDFGTFNTASGKCLTHGEAEGEEEEEEEEAGDHVEWPRSARHDVTDFRQPWNAPGSWLIAYRFTDSPNKLVCPRCRSVDPEKAWY